MLQDGGLRNHSRHGPFPIAIIHHQHLDGENAINILVIKHHHHLRTSTTTIPTMAKSVNLPFSNPDHLNPIIAPLSKH